MPFSGEKLTEIQAKTQRYTFEFLQVDLDLCFIFCDLVETESIMGAEQALAKAEDGYGAISVLLHHLKNAGQRNEIQRGLEELRVRLDGLRSPLIRVGMFGGEVGVRGRP
jgi:hypothetical protein